MANEWPETLCEDYALAKAVADAIAAALPAVPVELVDDPRASLKDLTELRIRVRPASWLADEGTRAYDITNREVHVGIVGACEASNRSRLNECLQLCDQVRALWGRGGALRTAQMAGHERVGPLRQSPIFDEGSLLENKLFVGNITIKYATQA